MPAPITPFKPSNVTNIQTQIDSSTTGNKLSYTVPAGKVACVSGIFASNFFGGAPLIAIRISASALLRVKSGTAEFSIEVPIWLVAGNTLHFNVATAVAATTVECSAFITEYDIG